MSAAAIPKIHVDTMGNIRKGAPSGLPPVISGALNFMGGSVPYLNPVGNESQIPPPPSGRNILAGHPALSEDPASERTAVDQGSHFGHVLNDDNAELDGDELKGISQIPAQALYNLVYAPHSTEGSIFTSQHASLPGARARAGEGGAPRAPGGGVGPTLDKYIGYDDSADAHRALQRGAGGDGINPYDAAATGGGGGEGSRMGIRAGAELHKARLLAGAGVGNTLEMVNPQAQAVLSKEKARDVRGAAAKKKKKMPKKSGGGGGISKKHRRNR